MMRIEKKVWPEFFQKIIGGEKNFELRLADFECNQGDALILREWDPETKDAKFWPKEDVEKYGFQVIGFK